MAKQFVLGKNDSTAKGQFRINPKLQRTKASGNRKGFTLGSVIDDFPISQVGIVVLPNRAVPRNLKFTPLKKIPPNKINPLQVPTVKSKGGFE